MPRATRAPKLSISSFRSSPCATASKISARCPANRISPSPGSSSSSSFRSSCSTRMGELRLEQPALYHFDRSPLGRILGGGQHRRFPPFLSPWGKAIPIDQFDCIHDQNDLRRSSRSGAPSPPDGQFFREGPSFAEDRSDDPPLPSPPCMITVRKSQERLRTIQGGQETWRSFNKDNPFDPAHDGFRSLECFREEGLAPGAEFQFLAPHSL